MPEQQYGDYTLQINVGSAHKDCPFSLDWIEYNTTASHPWGPGVSSEPSISQTSSLSFSPSPNVSSLSPSLTWTVSSTTLGPSKLSSSASSTTTPSTHAASTRGTIPAMATIGAIACVVLAMLAAFKLQKRRQAMEGADGDVAESQGQSLFRLCWKYTFSPFVIRCQISSQAREKDQFQTSIQRGDGLDRLHPMSLTRVRGQQRCPRRIRNSQSQIWIHNILHWPSQRISQWSLCKQPVQLGAILDHMLF